MKKRLLIVFLTITMLVSSASVSIFADSHIHNNLTFKPWENETSLPGEPDNYYLTKDITISSTWEVNGLVKLCLNGHVINASGCESSAISVLEGSQLYIYDCDNSTNHEGYLDNNNQWHLGEPESGTEGTEANTITGGVIIGSNSSKSNGAAIYNENTVNIYGGTIAGGLAVNGGAIYNKGTLSINKCELLGNVATENGGAIYNIGTFNNAGEYLADLKINNNKAKLGGGVYNEGRFECGNSYSKLELSNCVATENGGAIYNKGGEEYYQGFVGFSNGKINNCKAKNGGALYNCANSRIEFIGSEINSCSASESGGGIYNEEYKGGEYDLNTVVIDGNSKITKCEATVNGGAIFNAGTIGLADSNISENKVENGFGGGIYTSSNIIIGKHPEIKDNNKSINTPNNLYISEDGVLIIGNSGNVGAPTKNMEVSISMEKKGIFTNNSGENCIDCFKADDNSKIVLTKNNNLAISSVKNNDTDEEYGLLLEAIDEVNNNETLILLEDNDEDIVISKVISFTIDRNSFNNEANIEAGDGYSLTKSGTDIIKYQITKNSTTPKKSYIVPNTGIK